MVTVLRDGWLRAIEAPRFQDTIWYEFHEAAMTNELFQEIASIARQLAKETFGFIPNLEGIFAEAPALLLGSMALWDLFTTTSFSEIEQQVIYLTANYEHECHYCMAAHSGLAKKIGMSVEDIQARTCLA